MQQAEPNQGLHTQPAQQPGPQETLQEIPERDYDPPRRDPHEEDALRPQPERQTRPQPEQRPIMQQESNRADYQSAGIDPDDLDENLPGLPGRAGNSGRGGRRPQLPGGPKQGPNKILIAGGFAALLVVAIIGYALLTGASPTESTNDSELTNAILDINMKMDSLSDRLASIEDPVTTDETEANASQQEPQTPAQTTVPEPTDELPQPTEGPPASATDTQEEQPAPTVEPSDTPAAQPTAAATVTAPVQVRPGICGRSPAIQDVILTKLTTSSCRSVTNDELYRITDLPTINWASIPRPGDFAGLLNLTQVTFADPRPANEGTALPANTFSGLAGVQNITLSVHGLESRSLAGLEDVVNMTLNLPAEGTVHPGAFQGLPELENLTLNIAAPTKDIDKRNYMPIFDRMPRIRSLTINTDSWALPLKAGQFKNLETMQNLTIKGEIPPNEPLKVYWLPASLFVTNTYLADLSVTVEGPVSTVKAPPELVEFLDNLRHMEYIYNAPEDTPPEDSLKLYLSLKSPLLEDITNARQTTTGYDIVIGN